MRNTRKYLRYLPLLLLVDTTRCQVNLTLSGSKEYFVKGGNFTFTCIQTGTPETNVLVFYNDSPIQPDCAVTLSAPCTAGTSCGCVSQNANTRTHRFVKVNVGSSDAGRWTCEVLGIASENIPTFRSQPLMLSVFAITPEQFPVPDVVVQAGRTATFRWTLPDMSGVLVLFIFNASHVGKSLQILPSSNVVTFSGFDSSRFTYLGNTTASIMTFDIRDVTAWDAGWYRCGKDSASNVIRNCGQRLIVTDVPRTPTVTASSTTVIAGSDVTLTCQTTSTSQPTDHGLTLTYAWTRDGVRMSAESKRLLVLNDVSRSDRGRHYACVATESRGLTSETSSPFVLEVQYGPATVRLSPSTQHYEVAENSRLYDVTCSAVCNPACSYQWMKGDNSVLSDSGTLRIGRVGKEEEGLYFCRAWNDIGFKNSSAVSLRISEAAPSISRDAEASLGFGAGIGVGFVVGLVTASLAAAVAYLLILRPRSAQSQGKQRSSEGVYYNAREETPASSQPPETIASSTGRQYETLDSSSRFQPRDPSHYQDLTIYEIPRET